MQRNKEPFVRKSRFSEGRHCYLDEDFNYVYEYPSLQKDGTNKMKKYVIPYTEDLRNIFIFLDREDHDFDLGDRYEKEYADWNFQNKQDKHTSDGEADLYCEDFKEDPIECIATPYPDVFEQAFPEYKETLENLMAKELRTWIFTLPESQQNLIFAHLGEDKFLEEIRREEELETGKKITKQAMHNRWNKILLKACKHYGIEKPKQKHCGK